MYFIYHVWSCNYLLLMLCFVQKVVISHDWLLDKYKTNHVNYSRENSIALILFSSGWKKTWLILCMSWESTSISPQKTPKYSAIVESDFCCMKNVFFIFFTGIALEKMRKVAFFLYKTNLDFHRPQLRHQIGLRPLQHW